MRHNLGHCCFLSPNESGHGNGLVHGGTNWGVGIGVGNGAGLSGVRVIVMQAVTIMTSLPGIGEEGPHSHVDDLHGCKIQLFPKLLLSS